MLTLADLRLGLADLLDNRHAALVKSRAGKYYEPQLAEARARIEALPAALTSGTPLVDELAAADATHDGHGAVIWFTTEAVLRDPTASDDDRAAAARVRDAFIPELGELQAKLSVEAARAIDHKAALKARKKDLARFPTLGGRSLLDVAVDFVTAGESIQHLLEGRSVPKESRREATVVRPAVIGLLGRLREELAREAARDAKLPKDLEAQVFAHLDELAAGAKKKGKTKKPAAAGATASGGTTPSKTT